MTKLKITGGLAAVLSFFACGAGAQTIQPEPIALPASEFPIPNAELERLIAADDVTTLRRHAWMLWSGLTADSHQSYQGQVLPIWETWQSEQEAFGVPSAALVARQERELLPFARPSQDRHKSFARGRAPTLQMGTNANASNLLAIVKFNTDQANFLSVPHETPVGSGQFYSYTKAADLRRLNAYFEQHNTPIVDRKIINLPAAAIGIKILFLPVKAEGLTPIPLWAGPEQSTNPKAPTPDTWMQCVAVDPTNSRSGSAMVNCNGKSVQAEIVPVNRFYAIRIDAAAAQSISRILNLTGEAALAGGDYQIVVMMHITTREIDNWTWQTFWWQNGRDPPNKYPGSIDGMPDNSLVKGPWRNYAMCIADSMVVPSSDPKGKPLVCYNPFLESGQPDGIHSNCMSCHRMGTYPGAPYPPTYLPNGWIDPADPQLFSGQVKGDFLWALQNSAH
jgi:hypothetical protein